MSLLQAILLGIVQGLTEFLPVSSSGHIEITKVLFGLDPSKDQSLIFTVVLHFATALSTVLVFRKQIASILKGLVFDTEHQNRAFALKIIISMIPAALVGVLFNDFIEQMFNENLLLVGGCLLFTAFLLYASEKLNVANNKPVGFMHALIIGVSQAVAILPGISRSGSTIATALMLGVDKSKAAEFSFLMVIPLIFGKMAKDLLDQTLVFSDDFSVLLGGFLAAFAVGYVACNWMLNIIRAQRLIYFSIYCFLVGLICLFVSF